MDISSIEDITTSELGNDEVNIKITIDPILRTPNYNILNIDNLKDYYNLLDTQIIIPKIFDNDNDNDDCESFVTNFLKNEIYNDEDEITICELSDTDSNSQFTNDKHVHYRKVMKICYQKLITI